MRYTEWLHSNWNKDDICPPPLEPQVALDFLQQYLLGEDWYTVNPLPNIQANVEVVHNILFCYSKKYRKEYKRYVKIRRRCK